MAGINKQELHKLLTGTSKFDTIESALEAGGHTSELCMRELLPEIWQGDKPESIASYIISEPSAQLNNSAYGALSASVEGEKPMLCKIPGKSQA